MLDIAMFVVGKNVLNFYFKFILVVAIFPAPDKITLDHLSSLEFEGKKFMQSTPISSVLGKKKIRNWS